MNRNFNTVNGFHSLRKVYKNKGIYFHQGRKNNVRNAPEAQIRPSPQAAQASYASVQAQAPNS